MTTMYAPRPALVTAPAPVGIADLLAAATTEVLVMSTRGGSATDPIGLLRRVDRENLLRGVRYRVLFPDSARLTSASSKLAKAGADVRTVAEVPMDALVIDGTTAVLTADRSYAGVAVFQLPSVVTANVELFERIWPVAVPVGPAESARDSVLTDRERELLSLLCSGSTDESAAARLGISVRTVRRMVADIMHRLGARSRFQAGVKAADRGWLLERAG
ncbi:regulatory protein [Alloactinosynnema sp. L-07]|uniref:helix-turn-helix transcriptional regulator n=1 Tax=Alloactinosynnema sp. L-07 TaxID=1653480 RepID=UPI00065EF6DB|nr:helix-turn-helix transcriptional regulator [Alloactinosynnema sp. L-07]CRK58751.1 regulatory protein [Alloactinosynnema sp. L-07]